MRRFAAISRSVLVLAGVGGAVAGSWWLISEHHVAKQRHDAAARLLATRLGGDVGALVAQGDLAKIAEVTAAWLHSEPFASGVRVVDDHGQVHAEVRNDGSTLGASLQVQVLRNGSPWGTVFIDTAGPGDALSAALRALDGTSSAAWIGVPALGVVIAAAVVRVRAPGMGHAWREARDRVESTLDFLAEGVLITDTAGRLLFANAPARELMPAALSPGVGIDMLPWRLAGADTSAPERWWEGRGSARTVRTTGGASSSRTFIVRTLEIGSGRRSMGYLLTLSDVTELEDGRQQLAAAKVAADSANQAKGVFLANMSHEIRTPITGVIGSLDLLERTALTSTQERYLEAAQVSANTLHHLINDIIDLSRIEAGRVELACADFDLEECLVRALKVVADNAAAKGLELTLRISPRTPMRLRGDVDRLCQVVLNLVANGVKFTAAGGVHVTADGRETDGGRFELTIDVRDTGIGIPANRMDRLFKFFSQADSSTIRKYGGSGLGLAISRQLCELMGGGVSVNSFEGKGSTFTLSVTLGRAVDAATGEPVCSGEAAGRECVIIDAREQTRAALAELAVRAGLLVVDEASFELRPSSRGGSGPVLLFGCDQFTEELARSVERARASHGPEARVIIGLSRDVAPDVERAHAHSVDAWLRIPASSRALRRALVDSSGGEGARSHERSEPQPLLATPTGLRLLIAEDHPITQMITGEAAKAAGFEYEIASTGPEALDAALSGRFQAMLLDCHLPDLDGLEIARRVRTAEQAEPTRAPLVIIALTAAAMAEDRARCLDAGMNAYLTKPIRRDHLINELRSLTASASRPAHGPASAEPTPGESSERAGAGSVFDLRELTERCLDDPAMVRTMLDLFISATVTDLERLNAAVENAAIADVQALAHRVAGAAFQVTASDLAHAAKALEDDPESSANVQTMRDAFEAFRRTATPPSHDQQAPRQAA